MSRKFRENDAARSGEMGNEPETDKRRCSRKAASPFHLTEIKNQTEILINCLLQSVANCHGWSLSKDFMPLLLLLLPDEPSVRYSHSFESGVAPIPLNLQSS